MVALHNDIFDAALNVIATDGVAAQIVSQNASITLVAAITLNSSNFTGPSDSTVAGGGRKLICLAEDTGDMSNIAVTLAGDAYRVQIVDSGATVLVDADITDAPRSLTTSDQVNLSSFQVILKDPTS